jgi:hypothetical protein
MSKMVQIRNVPDSLHLKLKARAADSGRTLFDYLLAELERLAARPTRDDERAFSGPREVPGGPTPCAVTTETHRRDRLAVNHSGTG